MSFPCTTYGSILHVCDNLPVLSSHPKGRDGYLAIEYSKDLGLALAFLALALTLALTLALALALALALLTGPPHHVNKHQRDDSVSII